MLYLSLQIYVVKRQKGLETPTDVRRCEDVHSYLATVLFFYSPHFLQSVLSCSRELLDGGADWILSTGNPLVAHDKQQEFNMAYCLFHVLFFIKLISGFSTNNPVTCPEFSYFCDNGQCVSDFAVCDGIEDCYDGSDEIDCSEL